MNLSCLASYQYNRIPFLQPTKFQRNNLIPVSGYLPRLCQIYKQFKYHFLPYFQPQRQISYHMIMSTLYINLIHYKLSMTRLQSIGQIIALLLCIQLTSQLRFTLDGNEPQLSLLFQVKGRHTLYIVSSGSEQHDVTCLVTFQNILIFNNTGNDLEFNHDYEEGEVNITIISTSGEQKKVSFDFNNDEDPLVKIIDKRDIKILEQALNGVHQSLLNISRNQQFHIQRDESHKQTLEQSQSHIKWTGIIKIFFLLSSALVQLWIMKGFFRSGNNSYQPVETS